MSNAAEPLAPAGAAREEPNVPHAKVPRFPYVAAALCAACVGMAVHLWIRYSYAWDVTPTDLAECDAVWIGRYVEVEGKLADGDHEVMAHIESEDGGSGTLIMLGKAQKLVGGGVVAVKGRVVDASYSRRPGRPPALKMLGINSAVSRFTGASIAGLVVGAMGVFVFTVALRQWLTERRASRPPAP